MGLPFLLLTVGGCFGSPLVSQQNPASLPSGHVPTINQNIDVDGALNEDAWSRALVLEQFTEVIPFEGDPGDPPTRILMMRSDTYLYLGVICMEPKTDQLVLQNLRRDAFLQDDDRIEFVFDTFRDAKTSYFFQMSAAGSRGDALLGDNGRRFNKPWNGFWQGRTQILEDRWIAEIAIPFASMAFGDQDVWGANFQRYRGADRSSYRWASPRRELFIGNVSEAGELSGFSGIHQGKGFEFRPYFKLKSANPQGGNSHLVGDLGGEISWSITPQLTSSITWNTDFAETEVDNRQVNLTRFPLFFPEKRDFFLQDSTLFQFGERGRFGSSGTNLIPFFSRRIGLLSGREVPLDYGLRVAGRAGPWDLGFLGVHTGAAPTTGVPDGDLFVFRSSYNVSSSLAVGALFTDGNPASKLSNTVAGADVRWSSTKVLPGSLSVNSYLVQSDDEGLGKKGLGFGSAVKLTTSNWSYFLGLLGTQGDFFPAMGFVRRPGEMRANAAVYWNPRPTSGPVRKYSFGVSPQVWTDLSGNTISSTLRLGWLAVEFNDGDSFRVNTLVQTDRPSQTFPVADNASIVAGDYSWVEHNLRYATSRSRPVSAQADFSFGNWYDGDILRLRSGLSVRPDEHLNLGLSYSEDRGSLSTGDFTVRIEQLSLNYSFNADTSLESLIQSDNQSDTLGLQARFRWIVEDGRELFVVIDSGWEELPSGAIVPTNNDVTAKIVYAIRF